MAYFGVNDLHPGNIALPVRETKIQTDSERGDYVVVEPVWDEIRIIDLDFSACNAIAPPIRLPHQLTELGAAVSPMSDHLRLRLLAIDKWLQSQNKQDRCYDREFWAKTPQSEQLKCFQDLDWREDLYQLGYWLAYIRDHWGGAAHVNTTGHQVEVNRFINTFPEKLQEWGSHRQVDWDSVNPTSKVRSPNGRPHMDYVGDIANLLRQIGDESKVMVLRRVDHDPQYAASLSSERRAPDGEAKSQCDGNAHQHQESSRQKEGNSVQRDTRGNSPAHKTPIESKSHQSKSTARNDEKQLQEFKEIDQKYSIEVGLETHKLYRFKRLLIAGGATALIVFGLWVTSLTNRLKLQTGLVDAVVASLNQWREVTIPLQADLFFSHLSQRVVDSPARLLDVRPSKIEYALDEEMAVKVVSPVSGYITLLKANLGDDRPMLSQLVNVPIQSSHELVLDSVGQMKWTAKLPLGESRWIAVVTSEVIDWKKELSSTVAALKLADTFAASTVLRLQTNPRFLPTGNVNPSPLKQMSARHSSMATKPPPTSLAIESDQTPTANPGTAPKVDAAQQSDRYVAPQYNEPFIRNPETGEWEKTMPLGELPVSPVQATGRVPVPYGKPSIGGQKSKQEVKTMPLGVQPVAVCQNSAGVSCTK